MSNLFDPEGDATLDSIPHIDVIRPGRPATMNGRKVTVAAVQVDANLGASYLVVRWDGETRIQEWVHEYEVERIEDEHDLKIGLHPTKGL